MPEEAWVHPKKRIFLSLILMSTVLTAVLLAMVWRVTAPGLAELHAVLPWLFGGLLALFVALLFAGEASIVVAIWGARTPKLLYFWAWKAINLLFPFAEGLGRIFHISDQRIKQSFIEVNNHLVTHHDIRLPAERILILTPHCLQRDTCIYKITRDVENCHMCGGCNVGDLLALKHKYGLHLVVATGGTLARQLVAQARPKAIVAVACERDLTSGIQDVFPVPVYGVYNERPFGPCLNTRVNVEKLENAILSMMREEDRDGSKGIPGAKTYNGAKPKAKQSTGNGCAGAAACTQADCGACRAQFADALASAQK